MTKFSFVTWYKSDEGRTYARQSPVEVIAKDMELAAFLARKFNIKFDDICWTVEEIDASDIGGSLGLALNRFDPRNN